MKRSIAVSALAVAALFAGAMVWRHAQTASGRRAATSQPLRPRSTNSLIQKSTNPAPEQRTAVPQAQTGWRQQAPHLPPLIATAIGLGERRDFRTRLNAINALSPNLSAQERRALYDYLKSNTQDDWLRPGQAVALKNDILNALREQQTPPEELTDLLLTLREDPAQDPVLRDYALQHLGPWYAKVDGPQKESILSELQAASLEGGQSYSGTALLALLRVQQENPSITVPPVTNQVFSLLQDESANLLARITAVQLAGRLNLTEAGPQLERIIGGESQPETLRLAAIGALGSLLVGAPSPVLTAITNGSNERLKRAALMALRERGPEGRE